MIIDELKSETVVEFLKEGRRLDGRALDEYRPISVERDILKTAEGSARAKIGDSQVLVGVKVDLSTPFRDKPDEGTLTVGADLLPLASPEFEVGPPREDAIELARVVDRGVRSSEAIDMKSLYIDEEHVWGVFIDIYVLDHDGNLIDTAGLATVAALENLKIPKYEDGMAIRENYSTYELKERPISTTFSKIGNSILCDASYVEEFATDARLTIATGSGNLYAMQKAGKGSFTKDEVFSLLELAIKKGDELRKYLKP